MSLTDIQSVLDTRGGGVHKRLDENRELVALLQAKAPQFLVDHPWVIHWLSSHDEFFAALAPHAPLVSGPFAEKARREPETFPRQWPAAVTCI